MCPFLFGEGLYDELELLHECMLAWESKESPWLRQDEMASRANRWSVWNTNHCEKRGMDLGQRGGYLYTVIVSMP